MEVNFLRKELGLPLNDLFNGGVYHERAHNKTIDPDVEEIGHVSSSVQTKQEPLAFPLQPPLVLLRTTSLSPT